MQYKAVLNWSGKIEIKINELLIIERSKGMNNIKLTMRDDIQIKAVGSEVFIYDMLIKKAHILNETAGEFFLAVKDGTSLEDIANNFSQKYSVSKDEIEKDLEEMVNEFKANNLLVD
jgi:guanylate kinase